MKDIKEDEEEHYDEDFDDKNDEKEPLKPMNTNDSINKSKAIDKSSISTKSKKKKAKEIDEEKKEVF